MLEERNLLYFTPFYFPNGQSSAQPKYLVVLKNKDNKTILASLPTRKDLVPESKDGKLGCLEFTREKDGHDLACYRIGPEDDFLENGELPFYKETHLYGSNIKDYSDSYFELYPYEGEDYIYVGKIKKDIFTEILNCFKNNKSVLRGYRRMLNS